MERKARPPQQRLLGRFACRGLRSPALQVRPSERQLSCGAQTQGRSPRKASPHRVLQSPHTQQDPGSFLCCRVGLVSPLDLGVN